ncbi:hypothetical protein ACJX0J_024649, partial [Zea mays]
MNEKPAINRSIVSWNILITGAMEVLEFMQELLLHNDMFCGQVGIALIIFNMMTERDGKWDYDQFNGFGEKAVELFDVTFIASNYGITPLAVIGKMPYKDDPILWEVLLAACKKVTLTTMPFDYNLQHVLQKKYGMRCCCQAHGALFFVLHVPFHLFFGNLGNWNLIVLPILHARSASDINGF